MNLPKKRVGSILSGVSKSTEKDPLASALELLAAVLAKMNTGSGLQPVINVDVPDNVPQIVIQAPEPARPKKIKFVVTRDREGRIVSIEAETK